MYELEPQPPAGGQRALARTSLLLAAVLQVRRAARHGRSAAEPRARVVAQLLALRYKRRPAAAQRAAAIGGAARGASGRAGSGATRRAAP